MCIKTVEKKNGSLTLLPTGFSVLPSYGGGGRGGFLAHIVFNAVPLNRFDSNLVHLLNLSKKVTIFFFWRKWMSHSHVMTSSNLEIFTETLFGQVANGTVVMLQFR